MPIAPYRALLYHGGMTQSSAPNGDGAANNGTPKAVPEADLLAVKSALETKTRELEAATQRLADATTALGQERAAKAAAEAKVQELSPRIKELDELKVAHKATTAQLTELRNAQLESRRQALITRGISPENAKTLDEAAITVLEAHLPAQPKPPAANGYDAKGAGNTDISGLSARELIRMGVDQARH